MERTAATIQILNRRIPGSGGSSSGSGNRRRRRRKGM